MASGHVRTAPKGRTHGRTDQCCKREESPCQLGAVHTWHLATIRALLAFVRYWSNSGHWSPLGPDASVANDPFRHLVSTHVAAAKLVSILSKLSLEPIRC